MDISIVIPIYNEEENIPRLYEEIKAVMDGLGKAYEIIAIDDGSEDGSFEALAELHRKDPNLKVICFRRNFGQTAAMAAGFDYAQGEVIVTLDADLQNDPRDIPKLLEKSNEGYDIVSGWRKDRKDPFLTRRLPSILTNKLISVVTGVHLHDYGCTLKAYRKEIIKSINLYGEMHRFIPAIANIVGAKVAEIEVQHRSRKYGKSKYGLSRALRVPLDLFTIKFLLSYATQPIHLFGILGLLLAIAGAAVGAYLTVERLLFNAPLADRPLFLLAIFSVLIGVQFITMGLLSEILIRVYYEAQKKPIYSVREILGAYKGER